MSLRARINLLVTALTLLFLGLGAHLMLDEMRGQIREEIEASNRVTAQLMTAVLFSSQLLARGSVQQGVVQEFLERLGRVRANDIRLYDRHGRQVYRSPPSSYKAGRDAPAWFRRLVGPVLEPVRLSADSFTVEIVPDASRSVLDAWDDVLRVAWLALGFAVLVNGLLFALVSRALRPVRGVLHGFARAAAGDLSVRLPVYALPELQAIGAGFNRMLPALERTLATERELAENRQLTHEIQRHLEEERRVLARELHDEIGQYLTAVKTIAQATANRTQAADAQTYEASRAIVGAAGSIYDAMQRIIRRLRPMALERMGLADTLRDAVEEWRRLHPQLAFELRLPEALPRLGDDVEIALFRIAQESVTNAARHAGAQSVQIVLDLADARQLCLSVCDDGRGIAPHQLHTAGHYGLLGMRERAQALGGRLDVETQAPAGTCIHVRLPLGAGASGSPGP